MMQLMCSAETYQFEDNEENVIDDEGPFPTVAVGCDTEEDGADRSEHQYERNSPGDVSVGLVERLRQFVDGQRYGEEVESIPGLSQLARRRKKSRA